MKYECQPNIKHLALLDVCASCLKKDFTENEKYKNKKNDRSNMNVRKEYKHIIDVQVEHV